MILNSYFYRVTITANSLPIFLHIEKIVYLIVITKLIFIIILLAPEYGKCYLNTCYFFLNTY
ncbi:MAG: hypothetical protein DRH26_03220 [Deltaproteobacteria bacterium]|nr:MAG: hypothetical protein DRH26_03220 [Deltaproteobacteria bacterium]